MAFTYGFYNSKGGDRKYNADQMGNLFDGILNDGVFDNVGNIFATVPGEGLQVLVKSGRAWFNKTWSYNDAAYPIYLERPDVAVPRIDAIVLEVDRRETHRRNRIGYIVGIPDSTPKKPTLTNTDLIHQHPLAYVTVRAGTESILSSDIEIRVGQSDCPFVTGILETASIDDLFAAWNEQFTTWFEGVRSQLEGDVAANLLREIQLRLPIADKATSSEVGAGTVDNKYITPKGIAPHLGKIKTDNGTTITPKISFSHASLKKTVIIDNDDYASDSVSYHSNAFAYDGTLCEIYNDGNTYRYLSISQAGNSISRYTFTIRTSNINLSNGYVIVPNSSKNNENVIAIYYSSKRIYTVWDLYYKTIYEASELYGGATLDSYIISNLKTSSVTVISRSTGTMHTNQLPSTFTTVPYVVYTDGNDAYLGESTGDLFLVHKITVNAYDSVTLTKNYMTISLGNHTVDEIFSHIGPYTFVLSLRNNNDADMNIRCPMWVNVRNKTHNFQEASTSGYVNRHNKLSFKGATNKREVLFVSDWNELYYLIFNNDTSSPTLVHVSNSYVTNDMLKSYTIPNGSSYSSNPLHIVYSNESDIYIYVGTNDTLCIRKGDPTTSDWSIIPIIHSQNQSHTLNFVGVGSNDAWYGCYYTLTMDYDNYYFIDNTSNRGGNTLQLNTVLTP